MHAYRSSINACIHDIYIIYIDDVVVVVVIIFFFVFVFHLLSRLLGIDITLVPSRR